MSAATTVVTVKLDERSLRKVRAMLDRRLGKKTSRAELFKLHREICAEARAIARKKNIDYGDAHDALANYREAEAAGVDAPRAIVARAGDKWRRIKLAAAGKLLLKDDDVPDMINQLVHFAAALRERKRR